MTTATQGNEMKFSENKTGMINADMRKIVRVTLGALVKANNYKIWNSANDWFGTDLTFDQVATCVDYMDYSGEIDAEKNTDTGYWDRFLAVDNYEPECLLSAGVAKERCWCDKCTNETQAQMVQDIYDYCGVSESYNR